MCHFPPRSVPLSTNGHRVASLIRAWFSSLKERVRVKASLKVLDPESITGRCFSSIFLPELPSFSRLFNGPSFFDGKRSADDPWDAGRSGPLKFLKILKFFLVSLF